ncbi:ATP/GTP hydrolase [Bombilactobacillus mellifer]|uniref:tRNA threonylcarbamoyladenosine biosynthesis protein TsaE n=1 Tax=Bombilactobacillus mellifer TaxID=1218492 RepID=A0A0F4LTA4_9LACO|nr:tRNA (adenosine(37)-N6)-threonylcarbamoyltransferase complex ATPase subunit type 1 TsaE [Bombilactobacillus mellifer]KJY62012.1 ATP/GTP hydrolase [Bombilactobacillus mellifer]MCT6826574.1 tRNA (adenosine(37)-N6)-threonylcarbamoyltransferase complex ATPase subunit type 1 TsaE [Bombilactobacillus mellifer]MCT6844327.1 tRNA (adenosine(37)-N6)-threonylcarbamoyltransferase complex ATPase subunit type 1 TsaE [Bombilactobacillus mellifer]MCT6895013.1 tRNA (adenosine(37)-N6)-threonylcarbamoyltransfe
MTLNAAEKLGTLLQPYDVILLNGDLGAGKTTFTQGLARGLAIKRPIKSPTFTLIREYQTGRLPLYHMDMYRLENAAANDLDLSDYFAQPAVIVIEWSQFISEQLPTQYLQIELQYLGLTQRQLVAQAVGARFQELLAQWQTALN